MSGGPSFNHSTKSFPPDKVYCANCIHCKLVKIPMGDGGQYGLRVRCDAGKWRKKLGEEKVYKYFTVDQADPRPVRDVRAHGRGGDLPEGAEEEPAHQGRNLLR